MKTINVAKIKNMLNSAGAVKHVANKINGYQGTYRMYCGNIDDTDDPYIKSLELVLIDQTGRAVNGEIISLMERYVTPLEVALGFNDWRECHRQLLGVMEKINTSIRYEMWGIVNSIPQDNIEDDAVNAIVQNIMKPKEDQFEPEPEEDPYGLDSEIFDGDNMSECLEPEIEPKQGEQGYDPGDYNLGSRLTPDFIFDLGWHTSAQAARNYAREMGYGFPGIWYVIKAV